MCVYIYIFIFTSIGFLTWAVATTIAVILILLKRCLKNMDTVDIVDPMQPQLVI